MEVDVKESASRSTKCIPLWRGEGGRKIDVRGKCLMPMRAIHFYKIHPLTPARYYD